MTCNDFNAIQAWPFSITFLANPKQNFEILTFLLKKGQTILRRVQILFASISKFPVKSSMYSRVHISSDTAFLKIVKKPSIVQE